MKMVPPCKGCGARTDSCHCTCKAYHEWAKERKRVLAENRDPLREYSIMRDNQFTHRHQDGWHRKRG